MLSDFGFKRTFGNQTDTRFLRKSLQLLIKSDVPIVEAHFDNTVYQSSSQQTRGALVDLSCKDENGRVFIVEMQRRALNLFIHRAKFYAFKRLDRMVKRGVYKFDDLKPIYLISFLDGEAYSSKEFHQFGCIRNQHGELMDDQISYVVIELGKWNKTENEIKDDLDKLLLLMKYTDTATISDPIPKILSGTDWMSHIFEVLEKENLSDDERDAYEMELARVGSIIAMDEAVERKEQKAEQQIQKAQEIEQRAREIEQEAQEKKQEAQEIKQEAQEIKQEAQEIKQEAQEIKQKTQETEQKAQEKISSAISNLLQTGTFSDEKIAELLNVNIEYVKQIKQQLKN